MNLKDTIFALSTPRGKSAIAVFRISGLESHKIIKKISTNKKTTINKALLNYILDNNNSRIDQTLTTYFKSPKSFTGEDMVEISCHGSYAVIKKISKILIKKGLRIAEPGEFTRRALENNKLDLTKVEALEDLINANTEKQRELALRGLEGNLTDYSLGLLKKLKKILANIEAIIDFMDEDLPRNLRYRIKEQNKNIINSIEETIIKSSNASSIRNGFIIAVIGKPNTGKSLFVNHISGRDVSIVTSLPGTTTDLIESLVEIKGYQLRFVDTAGIRKHRNSIEKIGIMKTFEASKKSDLNVIFLKNNEKNQYSKINNKVFVRSKHDLRNFLLKDKEIISISSKTGYGISKLLNKTINILVKNNQNEIPIISRERQLLKLKKCLKHLKSFNLNKNTDMAADDIRSAIKEIEEIYHKFDIEQILDIIFSDFCIGK